MRRVLSASHSLFRSLWRGLCTDCGLFLLGLLLSCLLIPLPVSAETALSLSVSLFLIRHLHSSLQAPVKLFQCEGHLIFSRFKLFPRLTDTWTLVLQVILLLYPAYTACPYFSSSIHCHRLQHILVTIHFVTVFTSTSSAK